eukprot:4898891-Amphidinium_carterae.1
MWLPFCVCGCHHQWSLEVNENGEVDIELFCNSMCDCDFKSRRQRYFGHAGSKRFSGGLCAELEDKLRSFRTERSTWSRDADQSPTSPPPGARRARALSVCAPGKTRWCDDES